MVQTSVFVYGHNVLLFIHWQYCGKILRFLNITKSAKSGVCKPELMKLMFTTPSSAKGLKVQLFFQQQVD